MHTLYRYIHIYIHSYTYIYIHIYTYIYTGIYTYIYIHSYVYTYIHTYIQVYIHIYVYTYTYIHIYIYIYIYIYIAIVGIFALLTNKINETFVYFRSLQSCLIYITKAQRKSLLICMWVGGDLICYKRKWRLFTFKGLHSFSPHFLV